MSEGIRVHFSGIDGYASHEGLALSYLDFSQKNANIYSKYSIKKRSLWIIFIRT